MSRSHKARTAALIAASSVVLGLPSGTAATSDVPAAALTDSPLDPQHQVRERKTHLDAREATTPHDMALTRTDGDHARPKLQRLRQLAGPSAMVSIDPATGTPANLSSLDGYLTGPSNRRPAKVVLTYVRNHADALGLKPADLATFQLRSSHRDPAGIRHLSWSQRVDDIPVFGNGLRAHVDADGRLVAVQGAPIAGLRATARSASSTPELSAAEARAAAAEDVGGEADSNAIQRSTGEPSPVTWSNGDRARLVWFVTADGMRLSWFTYTNTGADLVYSHVIDAESGDVRYRDDLVDFGRGDAKVWSYYPGAPRGGDARVVNFFNRGWLKRSSSWLAGPNVTAFADVNDDDAVDPHEKTKVPGQSRKAQFSLIRFGNNPRCGPRFVCTWNPRTASSWRKNKRAAVTNAFYLANRFHDWLASKPIGFTGAAGNFERGGGDPVLVNALDGADTKDGYPDADHVNNASMATPPDGLPATMQLNLWHAPQTPNALDPYLPTSTSFDASILYHEYAHGLTNRLVVDATGNSTLHGIQAGAMGEGWSDYYAMDFLVAQGHQRDGANTDGQIQTGQYVLAGQSPFRTMAIDCDPGSKATTCTRHDGSAGGYTYGDFATIGDRPEVHSGGELWAQTLWDIRERLGPRTARMLITRALELSPADPSMLDMRDAIVQADRVVYDQKHTRALWRIFANRGMGWFAGTIDSDDVLPAEDFRVRPANAQATGRLTGTVTDADTGDPVEHAIVSVTGQDAGYLGALSDSTGADGTYTIPGVPVGTYRKVIAVAEGYETVTVTSRVRAGKSTTVEFEPRRDWAAASQGAEVAAHEGPDYGAHGCGPEAAIDLSRRSGWGSDTTGEDDGSYPDPKSITVELAEPIAISDDRQHTAFAVDPTASCGDAGSASTGTYSIEVSADGDEWRTAVDGTGDRAFDPSDRFTVVDVPSTVSADKVRYVRFTIRSPQVPNFDENCPSGPYAGCDYMDLTELHVFGKPAG